MQYMIMAVSMNVAFDITFLDDDYWQPIQTHTGTSSDNSRAKSCF